MVTSDPGGVPKYDTIGWGYVSKRRTDPRLAAMIREAIGSASSVVNIGAGAGSYEPSDCQVVALEPSHVMLSQHHGHRRVQGLAEHLPFRDRAFDAAMAILTVHHWSDLNAGLAEMPTGIEASGGVHLGSRPCTQTLDHHRLRSSHR